MQYARPRALLTACPEHSQWNHNFVPRFKWALVRNNALSVMPVTVRLAYLCGLLCGPETHDIYTAQARRHVPTASSSAFSAINKQSAQVQRGQLSRGRCHAGNQALTVRSSACKRSSIAGLQALHIWRSPHRTHNHAPRGHNKRMGQRGQLPAQQYWHALQQWSAQSASSSKASFPKMRQSVCVCMPLPLWHASEHCMLV